MLFQVEMWNVNCPQHIPQKFGADDVAPALQGLQSRLDAAEAENARLRTELDRCHARLDQPGSLP